MSQSHAINQIATHHIRSRPMNGACAAARRVPVSSHRLAPGVYRRRRAAALVLAVASVVGFGALLADPLGAAPVDASPRAGTSVPTVVIAQPGDTIWALAHRHRGGIDHGRFVEMLIAANGGPSIQAGQRIVIP